MIVKGAKIVKKNEDGSIEISAQSIEQAQPQPQTQMLFVDLSDMDLSQKYIFTRILGNGHMMCVLNITIMHLMRFLKFMHKSEA